VRTVIDAVRISGVRYNSPRSTERPIMKSATLRFAARTRYDWDEWFSKDHFILVYRVHYYCGHGSMEQQIRNQASRRGLGVNITASDKGLFVAVKKEARKHYDPDRN